MKYNIQKLNRSLRGIIAKALFGGFLIAASSSVYAVTDQEMDQARAIAAQKYIRYVNTGADYLDNYTPSSMSDLESKIKSGDKDNFKKFKDVSVASDYASWDKPQLVEYWSNTFFSGSKLLDKYDWITAQVKKSINNNVKVGATGAVAQEESPAPEEPATPIAEPTQQPQDEVFLSTPAEDAFIDGQDADLQQAEAELEAAQAAEKAESGSGSSTWVYIMILAILVVVVIMLVVYASRTMKGKPETTKKATAKPAARERESDYAPKANRNAKPVYDEPGTADQNVAAPVSAVVEETRMREKYAENLAAKSEMIRSLTRQLNDSEAMVANLTEENRRLKAEIERLKEHKGTALAAAQEREYKAHRPSEGDRREVFLGRVNSKGLFVRADRNAVEGHSVYRLSTANGTSGTFTVIDTLPVDYLLEEPGKWLSGGCFAKDIFDTDDRTGIITETPGTAVFKDGTWRVEKKAKIRYV